MQQQLVGNMAKANIGRNTRSFFGPELAQTPQHASLPVERHREIVRSFEAFFAQLHLRGSDLFTWQKVVEKICSLGFTQPVS